MLRSVRVKEASRRYLRFAPRLQAVYGVLCCESREPFDAVCGGSKYTRVSQARRAEGQGIAWLPWFVHPTLSCGGLLPLPPSSVPLNCLSGYSFLVLTARSARSVTTSHETTAVHCSVLYVRVRDTIFSRWLGRLTDRPAGVPTFSTARDTICNTYTPWPHSLNLPKSCPRG